MSQQRGTGMIAHLPPRPGKLEDALEHIMLPKGDPASPVGETEAPATTTVSDVAMTTPEPGQALSVRPRDTAVVFDDIVMAELTATRPFKGTKAALNTRIPGWLSDEIDARMRRAAEQGHRITKEEIVVLSLIRGLKLTPPPGWTLR